MDSSAAAIEVAARCATLNQLGDSIRFEVGDAFETLKRAAHAGGYDLVIADPPKLAVFDFELLDTSLEGEMRGPQADEHDRLMRISDQVRRRLMESGRFQLLENGETDFGPGDSGYLGGRWWVDLDGDGVQDPDDDYLLCPLLGPGRASP